ncbi:YncE family protein [Fibrella sp. WM1]|uniref:YncE family protein n=1 Tax=Fibrella musci TaxID=3242485 RepID=UPI0035205186
MEPFESGVLVFDERLQSATVSVSFINRQTGLVRYPTPRPGVLATDIFNNQNDRQLNAKVLSYAEVDGKGFLVLPETGQIEIVEGSSFRSISQLGGAEVPRYVVGVSPLKAYVSCWGGRTVGPNISVIDVVARRLRNSIPVSAGPEQMVVVGDELFVANSGGTSETGKTVSIINTTTDQVVTSIPVGDVPTSMVYDPAVNLIYVLCSGRAMGTSANGLTSAELVTINPATRQVMSRVSIGGRPIAGNPTNLTLDASSKTLYFLWRGLIYKTAATATAIPLDQPVETRVLSNYGFDANTTTLYGATTNKSAKPGVVLRFQPTGTLIDSISTEATPTGFYFK